MQSDLDRANAEAASKFQGAHLWEVALPYQPGIQLRADTEAEAVSRYNELIGLTPNHQRGSCDHKHSVAQLD
jgi:hypothetical protein